ncbi:hypothetical protein [Thiothrix subterranea]|uniref:Uncharacterized protein n=1 Tax=Thiothrix subterranea TaxID=2735563 RepID=A0AA51MLB0_9GAMM|nr:hypothetical protein [Thiothrix subterranea]MDQ5771000.1 hypothetical protein [Thiothrix subterranea]WML85784.1 hypothetical protein RCG00_15945 [Thiothrix subterranea]
MSHPNTHLTPVLDLHPEMVKLVSQEWLDRLTKTHAEVKRRKELAQPDNTYAFSAYHYVRWINRSVGL